MELEALVKDLGSRLGVTIETSPEGAFDLEVDGMPMAVRPVDDGRAVSLFAVIGQPPPERLEALYAMLLKANHLFAGTAGATLSLDPETNDVSLYRVLDLRVLDADTFYAEMERFVNSLDAWRTVVTEFRASEPSFGAVDAEPPRFGSMDGFMMA